MLSLLPLALGLWVGGASAQTPAVSLLIDYPAYNLSSHALLPDIPYTQDFELAKDVMMEYMAAKWSKCLLFESPMRRIERVYRRVRANVCLRLERRAREPRDVCAAGFPKRLYEAGGGLGSFRRHLSLPPADAQPEHRRAFRVPPRGCSAHASLDSVRDADKAY